MRLTGVLGTHFHPDHLGGQMGGWSLEGISTLLEKVPVPDLPDLEDVAAVMADEIGPADSGGALDPGTSSAPDVDGHRHLSRESAPSSRRCRCPSTSRPTRCPGSSRTTGVSRDDLVGHHSGDVLQVGQVGVELIHTPGHTPGSQCFLVDGKLVAGDTLFLEGCGRTDFPGSDPLAMYESIHTCGWPGSPTDAILFPGHLYLGGPLGEHGMTPGAWELRLPAPLRRGV